ncbi:MAG TPA: GAF domain-containing protein [Streptosporangiaceae bacterium]|nr:GAF domain-containing protein [Streptosporangiaceae bacterium]
MAALPGRAGDDRIAGEQAALRKVATLVARAAPPEEVFAAITEEAGRLLGASIAMMARFDPDGARTIVATWSNADPAFPIGNRIRLGGRNVPTLVFQTHRAARIDNYADGSGPTAEAIRALGIRATVGVPVSVEGRLWGLMSVGSRAGPLPAGTEAYLAGFTELAATAIANAQARVELRGFAEEQAALRRVATLVARAAPPAAVFAAIAEEAGRMLGADYTTMARYDPEDFRTVVATWSSAGAGFPVNRLKLGGLNVPTLVFQTGRPARIDDYDRGSGPIATAIRKFGLRATVGVPVSVEGRLWGVMIAGSRIGPLPAGTEARLAGFTELAATAIANSQARVDLGRFAEEQAALRRVATLVARAAPPAEVLTAVAGEAGRLVHADHATMGRYDTDDTITVVATWGSGTAVSEVGARHKLGGQNLHTTIFQTQRPARMDGRADASGEFAEVAFALGIRAAVGVPVSVGGRLWGVMVVESRTGPLPAGIETRLAGFTELAGTAIANAAAQAALTASRARIVTTADATRRRIERNLHDGAQQRLVSLALDLRAAQATAPAGAGQLAHELDEVAAGLDDVLNELREIASGLHPVILAEGGLRPALRTLARRCAVPAQLDIQLEGRLPEPVETAAYYTVAEALTNTAKHARATAVEIEVAERDRVLHILIRDDGQGGADVSRGSGLMGLRDRAEALGGHLLLHSPPGAGTSLDITLPVDERSGRDL